MSRTLRLALGTFLASSICLTAGSTTGNATTEPARVPVVKDFVAYGDPPLSVPPRHRARLSFQGRRGDVVHLSGAANAATLRIAGRTVHATWSPYGYGDFYRLGASGRYTFHVRTSPTDPDDTQRLLLEKLALRTVSRDSAPVRFGRNRRGFVSAVSFDLDRGERTMIRTPGYAAMVLTEHEAQLVYGDPILEVGQLLGTARGDSRYQGPLMKPGEVIVLVGRQGSVGAVGSVIVPITLDGAPTAVPASQTSREVALRFPAVSGQLVHLVGVPMSQVSPTLYGPTSATTRAPVAPGPLWRVLESGIQTVSVFPRPGTSFDAGAAVATRIGAMTAGGPALTFAAPQPGRWVYADVDNGYVPTLTATASTFAPGVTWSASVTQSAGHNCLMPQGPLGCGETAHATVDAATPQASAYMPLPSAPASFVVLAVPPGATGSVDLQVTKPTPPAPVP